MKKMCVLHLVLSPLQQQQQYHAVAGFSVGEMTALIFANAISFEDGKGTGSSTLQAINNN